MAINKKIAYQDKVGVEPKTIAINQWQDDDCNEVKSVVNNNADVVDENNTLRINGDVVLQSQIDALATGTLGSLAIADVPTQDGVYIAEESGTYINAGNLVVDLSSTLTYISISGTLTTFAKIEIPMSTLGYSLVSSLEQLDVLILDGAGGNWMFISDITLDANKTIPSGVTLHFNGGVIGGAFTITGTDTKIEAGLTQIFDSNVLFDGDWSIAEIYPQWFGAIADNTTDSASYFQAMFDFIGDTSNNINVVVPSGSYKIQSSVNLPTSADTRFLSIRGYGASLITETNDVSIFKRMPTTQAEASSMVSNLVPIIQGFRFVGTASDLGVGQVGLNIGATYSMVVEDCSFENLEFGSIGTFCLNSKWENLRYTNCGLYGLTLQTGFKDYTDSLVWTGAAISNSASNVSVINGVRVFGKVGNTASFCILGSDSVVLNDCISEGGNDLYDVFFDYQGSTTVMKFTINNFHAENPSAKVNFKIRQGGVFILNNLRRSYPASILDASGSSASYFIINGINYLGNMPTIWFYHTNGWGYGGTPTGTADSTGSFFEINNTDNPEDCLTTSVWETSTLPRQMVAVFNSGGNNGYETLFKGNYKLNGATGSENILITDVGTTYYLPTNTHTIGQTSYRPKLLNIGNGGINMQSNKAFTDYLDGSFNILAAKTGLISANTTKTVNITSTDDTDLTGLTSGFVTNINYDDSDIPSGIIIGNIETGANTLFIRFANITTSDITISSTISCVFNAFKN